nr:hypothetical protein [Tanacetum cinerariifolium]
MTTLKLCHSSYPSRFRFNNISSSPFHPLLRCGNAEYRFVKTAKSFGINAVLSSSDDRLMSVVRPKWLKLFGISSPPPPPPPPSPTAYEKFCVFVEDVWKESKQVLQVSMRKQLIKNTQFVDVLAYVHVASFFTSFVEKHSSFAHVVAVCWFVFRLGIYVLVKEQKSKENSKPKTTVKDSIKGQKSRRSSKPKPTVKGTSFNASAGIKHFCESLLEESRDVFGTSLKKQLVKTLIVLDLVAVLQIAKVFPSYKVLL